MAVEPARIGDWSLASPTAFYYLCLAVLVLVLLGMINLLRSSIGRAFMGVRDFRKPPRIHWAFTCGRSRWRHSRSPLV